MTDDTIEADLAAAKELLATKEIDTKDPVELWLLLERLVIYIEAERAKRAEVNERVASLQAAAERVAKRNDEMLRIIEATMERRRREEERERARQAREATPPRDPNVLTDERRQALRALLDRPGDVHTTQVMHELLNIKLDQLLDRSDDQTTGI